MLLTNHALTGVVLGTYIENELILAPIAFSSHLVLDSLPHFGIKGLSFRTPKGFIIGSIDFAGAITVLVVSLIIAPERASHTIVGWLGATLPDLFYLFEIFAQKTVFPRFRRFHAWIQWAESPPGTIVDAVWAVFMISILHAKL
jgi:hypothetical protein